MRPREKDRHLPACVYKRHGAYWYVKRGKWTRLADNLPAALTEYSRLIAPAEGGCDDLLERTLAKAKETVKPNTALQYEVACKKLKPILAEFSPAGVRPHHIANILDHHRKTPNMANRMLTFLRLAFSNALTWGLAESNPTYGVKRHAEKRRDRYLTDEEFLSIRSQANPSLQCIMDLAYMTAQRIGDILAIKAQDVADDGIYFQQQKTGKKLLVRAPGLREAVERSKALHGNLRGLTLLHGRGGRPLSYGGVRDLFDRAATRAGVLDAHLHDIRAKSLTDAKRQGKNAQKLAGHSTEAMTNRYLRDRQADVVEGPSIGQVLDNWTAATSKSAT